MFYAHKKPAAVRPANAADCNMKSDGKFWKQGSEPPNSVMGDATQTDTDTKGSYNTSTAYWI